MLYRFFILTVFLYLLVLTKGLKADYEITEWSVFPVIGLWFGPVTPVPGTSLDNILNTSLGGGLFIRVNFPTDTWMLECGSSLSYYNSDLTPALYSVPTYFAGVYKVNIDFPLKFLVKFGTGFHYGYNFPEMHSNVSPILFVGLSVFFPAGRYVNIGLRFDYYPVFESYLSNSTNKPPDLVVRDVGLTISFNARK